jgi:acetylglutamate kinase
MSKEISLEEVKKFWPQSAPNINNIKKYVEKYQNETIVIKYGGNVLIDKDKFNNFIEDINILNKLGLSIVVVHGGGPRIKRELDKSNIPTKFIRGLRVTDENIIKIVESVLIDFNNDIVSALKKKGSDAVSINTKTNNIINVTPENKELGFVGIPDKVNNEIIKDITDKNQIPVVAPLGLGKNNSAYNINGDTAAGAIAKSLNARRLLLMTNVEGVLDKEKKLITEISSSKILEMIKNEIITGGMIPKINTCLDAVNKGVRGVVIMDGRKNHSILNEIFSDAGVGTLIR